MAELESQLAEALEVLARQKQESEENATSFSQAMARLSHSERTLGQTKAKLMDAEQRVEKSEAKGAALSEQLSQAEGELNLHRAEMARLQQALEAARVRELEQNARLEALNAQNEAKARELEQAREWASRALEQEKALRELAESLSRDSAEGAAECARLNEHCKTSEAREQRALGRALNAEAEQATALTELQESKARQAELTEQCAELKQARDAALTSLAGSQATVAESEAARAQARQELASAELERTRFIGMFAALESLGREIAEVGSKARKAAETRANVKPEDTESLRATLRPEPVTMRDPRSLRSRTAPEITIDGVRLDP